MRERTSMPCTYLSACFALSVLRVRQNRKANVGRSSWQCFHHYTRQVGSRYRQENLPYFYANIDRVFQRGYQPSQDDILRVRSKTTGISETRFDMRDMIVRLFDVGGQRSERRKWASCFENVTSILFLVSLSDYNACIIEDKGELPP
jgi:hypothetical protein